LTDKQRKFIERHKLATQEQIAVMTKKEAEGLIVPRIKELQAARAHKEDENDDD